MMTIVTGLMAIFLAIIFHFTVVVTNAHPAEDVRPNSSPNHNYCVSVYFPCLISSLFVGHYLGKRHVFGHTLVY